jgi:Ni,Fe-hydrogenase III small subunit
VTVWRRVFRTLRDGPATERAAPVADATTKALATQLDGVARAKLGRSLAIRHVDAGSCNGCELETHALNNIVYDLERFGLRFVASPRHADVLLVTGPLSRNMREALLLTWQSTPDPKWVVAVGDCAIDGGVFKGSYAVDGSGTGGIAAGVPVDLKVPGCPPTPAAVLTALRTLIEINAT